MFDVSKLTKEHCIKAKITFTCSSLAGKDVNTVDKSLSPAARTFRYFRHLRRCMYALMYCRCQLEGWISRLADECLAAFI